MTQDQLAPHVLIISHDVVGSHMAGPGIRYWEMARVLAAHNPVTLLAPRLIDLEGETFTTGAYRWGDATSLAPLIAEAGLVIANGYVLSAHPELARIAQPLALDLYDPQLLEDLELLREAPMAERNDRNLQGATLLRRQLAAGDFFLCATERQRDLYIGALIAEGRVRPTVVDRDPQLRGLIDVVPFGLPAEPPVMEGPALRGIMPAIGTGDCVLLWTGGLWDWLDPITLVRAMPRVVVEHPQTRLVFLAGQHPGNVARMRMPALAQQEASALGLLGSYVFFHEQWVPYARRADVLLESNIAVSLHRDHLETAYAAVRSRFLDHLWAGLPSVVSAGDAAAELVERHGLGRVVPAGDVDALANALGALIADGAERRACGSRARELAERWTWQACLAPLVRWCRAPHAKGSGPMFDQPAGEPEPASSEPATSADTSIPVADEARNAALAVLEQHRHVREPSLNQGLLAGLRRLFIQQLVRPFVTPLLEAQNTYNADVAKALNALAENADGRRSHAQQALDARAQSIEQRLDRLEVRAEGLGVRAEGLGTRVDGLEPRTDELEAMARDATERLDRQETRVDGLEPRTDELEAAARDATQRLAALDQRVIDLDEVDTTLAEQMFVERDKGSAV